MCSTNTVSMIVPWHQNSCSRDTNFKVPQLSLKASDQVLLLPLGGPAAGCFCVSLGWILLQRGYDLCAALLLRIRMFSTTAFKVPAVDV